MGETEFATVYNMETDISKMEAPTFTTIERNQQAAMLALDWDHQVNLVGKKVLNPMIHCCDQCLKPILVYGRMIPCKHVFCLGCAKKEDKQCPRCKDKVSRVEPAGLGNIYLCTQGGTRYGNSGCRRTYLSTRDLQAHVLHRHSKGRDEEKMPDKKEMTNNEAIRNAVNSLSKASLAAAVAAASSINSGVPSPYSTAGAAQYSNTGTIFSSAAAGTTSTATAPYNSAATAQYRPSAGAPSNHISVINTRQSNLISIPIHGNGTSSSEGAAPPPLHTGYAPGSYPGYPGYTTQPSPAVPVTSFPQGAPPPTFNQPPPTYPFTGSYPSAPPPAAGQYTAGPPPAPAPFNPAPAAGYAPGYQPTGGAPPPFQGHWSRPPPAAVRPPPPSNAYYRR